MTVNLMDAIVEFDADEVYFAFREKQGELNDREDELREQLADVAALRVEMEYEARTIFDNMIAKLCLTVKEPRNIVRLIILYRMFNGVGDLGDDKMAVEEILEAYGIKG